MPKSFQNGDVSLHEVTLSNAAGASINILPQVQGFDVWEDMAAPTVYATFYIHDAIGLLQEFPIVGEETLSVTMETPGISSPVTYRFRVFEPVNIQATGNRRAYAYTLRCISEEHMISQAQEVGQSFEGSLAELVQMVMSQYVGTKKKLLIEPTKGIRQLVLPKWTPLQCIDYAKQEAVSRVHSSSSYVFYETQAGFTFATVEQVVKNGRDIGSRVFTFLQDTKGADMGKQYRSVIEYENLGRNDTVDLINSGTLSASTETFDLHTKQVAKTSFDITKAFRSFVGPDTKAQMTQSSAFIKKFSTDPERIFMLKDSSRPEDYVEDVAAPRAAYKSILNSNITRCLVHGDVGLKAGDLVTLNLPAIKGFTGARGVDRLQAGNYIILRLRHIVSHGQESRHQVSFDAAKVGFPA